MTLLELLIAVVIMVLISVAVLGSVTTLSTASQNYRGIANVDGAALSYAEAIKNHVNFHTTLAAAITNSSTSLTVANGSELSTSAPSSWSSPSGGSFTCTPACAATALEVVVDGELIKVGSGSGTTLSSLGRGDRGTAAQAHALGATLNPIYTPCPMAAQLSPVMFVKPSYVSSVRITEVDYWIPSSSSFVLGQSWNGSSYVWNQTNRNLCESAFQLACPDYSNDNGNWASTFTSGNLPQCDPGLQRVWVTATGDSTTGNSVTVTSLLVRRANG